MSFHYTQNEIFSWSHLLKKFLIENLIFCAVLAWEGQKRFWSDFQSCSFNSGDSWGNRRRRLNSFEKCQTIRRYHWKSSLTEMRSTVAGGKKKQTRIEALVTRMEFHSSTINPFTDALMKEITYAFDLSELHELIAFLKLDPADLPETTSSEFWEYGTQELRVL